MRISSLKLVTYCSFLLATFTLAYSCSSSSDEGNNGGSGAPSTGGTATAGPRR
jgi:hypothetical protein